MEFGNLADVKPKPYPSKGPVASVRAKLVIEHFDKDGLLCREKVLIQESRAPLTKDGHFDVEQDLIKKYFYNIRP